MTEAMILNKEITKPRVETLLYFRILQPSKKKFNQNDF